VTLFFVGIVMSGSAEGATITVNPVAEWTPVVSEFRIHAEHGRMAPEPPFVKVKAKYPSIPSAWEALKDMVRMRLAGTIWSEDEPVISGWRPWESEEGAAGIEVMRSDNFPSDGIPLRNVPREVVEVRWRVDIWGREGRHYRHPERPELDPAQKEYQDLIKKKVVVRDFSFGVYKVEGDYTDLKNLTNKAASEAFWKPEPQYLGYEKPLADYEARLHAFRIVPGTYEVQLKAKLYFPELDEQKETTGETEVEASLRFMCVGYEEFRRLFWESGRAPR
jgi:hypothetical protein